MNTSSWKWSSVDKLKFYGNSTVKLDVLNEVAETDENIKNGRWHFWTTWMYCSSIGNRACTITFNAKNARNPRTHKFKTYKPDGTEVWYNDSSSKRGGENLYWGISLDVNNTYGGQASFSINYCNQYYQDNSYPYTSTESYNSESQKWSDISDREVRQFKIVYDGISTIKFYANDGNELIKTFTNVKGISRIGIEVGTASNIVVTDFKVLRKSDYGLAKPEIDRAIQEYNKENYSSTISIISRVLDSYKAAFPYYIRGRAYSSNKYNKAAVDDFTTALSYSCDAELRRNIYFNRGICRLLLDDYDNGVADMRNAGEEGKAFLKEYNLENYQPGQRKASSAGSRSNSGGGSSTPQLKKGNSSSNSNNSTPALRKTN
ncbi:MAG: hypothetical protein KBT06_02840 [Prevotellaceae bacterium]|nr:hypothetical protein [Candidatus Colivivens equi]